MRADPRLSRFAGAWAAGIVGCLLGGLVVGVSLDALACALAKSSRRDCADQMPLLHSVEQALVSVLVNGFPTSLLVSSVLLGVSVPGRYLTREQGIAFNALVGFVAGAALPTFFFMVLDKQWVVADIEYLGYLESALRGWCGEHGWLCQCLAILVVLFWLAYWTLLPALLAAGLMRVGRSLMRLFRRVIAG
jgi:hypothetical protein